MVFSLQGQYTLNETERHQDNHKSAADSNQQYDTGTDSVVHFPSEESRSTNKASVFTRDDLITYLRLDHHNRPDYLIRKVMMIIGFCCLPRGEEMRGISLDHIRVHVK